MKNLLLVIDNCETTSISSPIVAKTIELASAFNSKIWLLHIVPSTPKSTPFNVDQKVLREAIAAELCDEHDFLQRLAQCMRDRSIDAQALLVKGATIRTILNESNRLDVDLIVLECHKHEHLYGIFTEFTEEGILSKCQRPVLFMPGIND